MWRRGWVKYNELHYLWQAKVYDEPSKYGIGGGRVSKLQIHEGPLNTSAVIYNWDRGADINKVPSALLKKVIMACEKRR